jgi:hypothetical protein
MQLFEAATLDRKSGEAEGSAVRHSGAPNLPFYNSKLGDACWQMLLGAFWPQTTTEYKNLTNSEQSGVEGPAVFSPTPILSSATFSLRHSTSLGSQ